jgi:uncharacterized protein (DUF433 family)
MDGTDKMHMAAIDWTQCEDAERIPGKVSGAWLVKGTRLPVESILIHADDYTPEEIATEIFQGITPNVARRVIAFARQHATHPA